MLSINACLYCVLIATVGLTVFARVSGFVYGVRDDARVRCRLLEMRLIDVTLNVCSSVYVTLDVCTPHSRVGGGIAMLTMVVSGMIMV